jgi:hypothetical protein
VVRWLEGDAAPMADGWPGMSGPLGRRPPTDWRHVERHALTAAPALEKPTPVVMGTMWPIEADRPVQDSRGTWWIKGPFSGRSRGGHAYALEPLDGRDSKGNWLWFNQVSEGICVSEGVARAAWLLLRRRFQPRPLYDLAQRIDEWAETPPEEGTSVRAGFDVWRTTGLIPARRGEDHWEKDADVDPDRSPDRTTMLPENRWALSAQEILDALGTPGRDWATILNSWARGYPHRVRIAASDLQWLLERDGEAGIPVF